MEDVESGAIHHLEKSTSNRVIALSRKALLPGATQEQRDKASRTIEKLVAGVGVCRMNGTRFLALQLQRIVEHMPVWVDSLHLPALERLLALRNASHEYVPEEPADIRLQDFSAMVLQAFCHSRATKYAVDKNLQQPQYEETSRIWADACGSDGHVRVKVKSIQTLKAAKEAYVKTDMVNFTTLALTSHCKRALV